MALQAVELLYGSAPSLDIPAIGRRVEQLRGAEIDTHVVKPGANGLIFHKDQTVQYDDGAAPAQTALFVASEALPFLIRKTPSKSSSRASGPR